MIWIACWKSYFLARRILLTDKKIININIIIRERKKRLLNEIEIKW